MSKLRGLILICLVVSARLFGQTNECSLVGQVADNHGHTLAGAVVQVLGANEGVATDNNGKYQLNFPCAERVEIRFSFLGFETMDTVLSFNALQSKKLNIELHTASAHLHQMVVEEQRHQDHESLAHDELSQIDLKENHQGTLIKSLEVIPGVQSINVGVGISKPVLRGLSMNRVAVNQNGVRQEGQQWGSDHGLEIDPFNPEKVEVIKGPSTLRFGSGSSAGIINILPAEIAPKDTLLGDVSAIYKTNNQHLGGSARLKWNKNNWFGYAQLSAQEFGDYEVPADSFVYNTYLLPIENRRLKNTSGSERSFAAELGKTAKWGTSRLTYTNYGINAGLFPGAMGIPRSYTVAHDSNFRDIDLPRQLVQHHKATSLSDFMFKNNKTQLQLILSAQQNLRYEFAEPHAHGSILTDSLALALDLITTSAQVNVKQYQNDKTRHEFGTQAYYQLNEIDGFEFLIPAYNSLEWGGYYVLDYQINPKTKLSAGARVGLYQLNAVEAKLFGTADANSNGSVIRSAGFTQTLYNWSAAAGVKRNLNKWNTLRVNANKSYRNPSVAELASNGIHHGTFRHEQGNPSIGQEHGLHADVGLQHNKNKLSIDLAGFYSWYLGFIYLKPTARFSNLPEGGQLFSYTQNDALFAGAELKLDWKLTEQLSYRFTGDMVWNQNLTSGLGLPFTPPARVQNQLRYRIPLNNKHIKWTLTAGYNYVFAQNRTDRNELKTPEYHLVNAGSQLVVQVNRIGEVRFNVQLQNAFNTAYFNHLSRYRYLNIPEQGRNIVFGLTVPFGLGA